MIAHRLRKDIRHSADVGFLVRVERDEELIKQHAEGKQKLRGGVLHLHAKDLFLPQLPHGDLLQADQVRVRQGLPALHVEIAVRDRPDVRGVAAQLHPAQDPGGIHRRRPAEGVGPQLAVHAAAGQMVARPAHDNAGVLADAAHLVILALKAEELPGQEGLPDMPHQAVAHQVALRLLVLHHVVDGAQILLKHVLHEALVQLVEEAGAVAIAHPVLVPDGVDDHVLLARMLPDQLLHLVVRAQGLYPVQGELLAQDALRDRGHGHQHHHADDEVVLRSGVVRHDGRDRLRIVGEQLRVVAHVVAQHIALAEHVDEAAAHSGREGPRHLKEIVEFVLDHEEAVFDGRGRPQILMEAEPPVQLLLLLRGVDVLADRRVVLLNVPAQVEQRHLAAAEPVHVIHALVHGQRPHLAADAHVMAHLRQDAVLGAGPFSPPEHPVIALLRGGRRDDVGDRLHQRVAEGVHQTVRIAVKRAEGQLLEIRPAELHDAAQADLPGAQ